jgi:hypothetical protein
MGFRVLISATLRSKLRGPGLLPQRVWLPPNTPAFTAPTLTAINAQQATLDTVLRAA